jgi:hypothetical protein
MSAGTSYRALARKVATLPEQIVRAGAVEMQKAIIASVRIDTGDQTLSGFSKRRRTKLSATVKVSVGRSFATATVAASPRRGGGQWTLLEYGTDERVVGELKRKDKSVGPGGKHMNSGQGWRTGPWSAGRSPEKRTFSQGVQKGTPAAERAMAREWEQSVG